MKRASQGGFTLLELLLAVTLLAAMLGMAWSGLGFALRAWDTGEVGHRAADLRLAENFLRRELSEIFPMRWKNATELKFAFEGDAKRLRFVSVRPPGISEGGLALVGLELESEPGARTQRLVMRRAPPDEDARDFGPLERAKPNVILADIGDVEIAYFGTDNDVNEPRWSDAWTVESRIPLLVRLRITLADGTRLPDLVVRLMVGEEAGCLENVYQRQCRPRRQA